MTKLSESYSWPTFSFNLIKLNQFLSGFSLILLWKPTKLTTTSSSRHSTSTSSLTLQSTLLWRLKTVFKFLICLQEYTWMMFATPLLRQCLLSWYVIGSLIISHAKSSSWSLLLLAWTNSSSFQSRTTLTPQTITTLLLKVARSLLFQLQVITVALIPSKTKTSAYLRARRTKIKSKSTTGCTSRRKTSQSSWRRLSSSRFCSNFNVTN